ncbi:MAG: prepilin-type N-terminal cleavage/methylation domain-containing protein [Elusimicrobiales bacterium]|nr:prepilin-type N-terminal cleavage/methylation domain-containing protein [Elusimicrobiales bacterium]
MRSIRKGFTLIELMVVVIILGVLTSMGVPYYLKTVESAKAMDAVAVTHMVGVASQMMVMDNPTASYSGGLLTNTCNLPSRTCPSSGPRTACDLVSCNYISRQDWDGLAYSIRACNPNTGAGGTGCSAGRTAYADRREGKYTSWAYYFTTSGICVNSPTSGALRSPSCPEF